MPLELQDQPLISVVMPVYNAERYVAEAIYSILAQTYTHFEFIIVDDGSTDGSAGIVRECAARDARIRPLLLGHGGIVCALNTGVEIARGDLIARMDADDIALPERFAVQLAWMRHTGVDICGSCVKRFGAEHNLWWFPETHTAIVHEMLFRCALLHPTIMLRAEIAKSYSYNEQTSFEDYELWTRLALRYRLGNVPQVLLKHRHHRHQVQVVHSLDLRAGLRRFRKPYFHTLFPQATAEDYDALVRVAENESISNLADLDRSGRWLVRLAQTPDNFLRERMASRWWTACQRAAHLGLGCYRLYQQIAPLFGATSSQRTFELWLGCGLRLKAGSRLTSFLKQVKYRARR